jgi:hypothetical protein
MPPGSGKGSEVFPGALHLAEIPFVQKKFAEAREEFLKLQTDHPKDDLLRFRIYLTYLLEGIWRNPGAARRGAFLSDTPIYYYSHAAWEYSRGNEAEGETLGQFGLVGLFAAEDQQFRGCLFRSRLAEARGASRQIRGAVTAAPPGKGEKRVCARGCVLP